MGKCRAGESVLHSAFRKSGLCQREPALEVIEEDMEWWEARFGSEISFVDYVAADNAVSLRFFGTF